MSNLAKKIDILHKSSKTVFSTDALALYWNTESKRTLYVQISRAKNAGFIQPIQKGLYAISEVTINPYELAGNLQHNSYISFETVLSQASIIQQWHGSYFSASARQAKVVNTHGVFEYKRLPENVINNRLGITNAGAYFIATPERAICDYIYKSGPQQFDDPSELDPDKLIAISQIYNNLRLESNINQLISQIS